jgi:hypothetical protein
MLLEAKRSGANSNFLSSLGIRSATLAEPTFSVLANQCFQIPYLNLNFFLEVN